MNDLHNSSWFCVRTQPKHEHIAEANLRRLAGVEVFNPRIRSRKLTQRGPVWMTESLFPNYVFVRFALEAMVNDVKFTSGVSHILHFGDRYPIVPEQVIEDLRKHFGEGELQVSAELPAAGDQVTIADRAFFGMQAVVLRVLPVKQRVQVLIEMLGRNTMVTLNLHAVVPEKQLPGPLLNAAAPGNRITTNQGTSMAHAAGGL